MRVRSCDIVPRATIQGIDEKAAAAAAAAATAMYLGREEEEKQNQVDILPV